jgi:threonine dehydrogenase-like Zn-dependent dehydrogenase
MLKSAASSAAAGCGVRHPSRHGLVLSSPRAVGASANANARLAKTAGSHNNNGTPPSTVAGASASTAQVTSRTQGAEGHAAHSRPYLGKKAVVIGAGPVGITAAMFLVQQGFAVNVSSSPARLPSVATGGARRQPAAPAPQLTITGLPARSARRYTTAGLSRRGTAWRPARATPSS